MKQLQQLNAQEIPLCLFFNRINHLRPISLWFAVINRLGNGVFWYVLILTLPLIYGVAALRGCLPHADGRTDWFADLPAVEKLDCAGAAVLL
ncbi:MAG: hypothetical protein R3E95_02065 [Thiolinea sp.]